MIGISLGIFFHLTFYLKFGWTVLGFVAGFLAMYEYTSCHKFILQYVHIKRKENQPLILVLVESLCTHRFTLFIYLLNNATFLVGPSHNYGLFVVLCLVLIVYYKLQRFNQFMTDLELLAQHFKKDPERTQEAYDQEIREKVKAIAIAHNPDNIERKDGDKSEAELLQLYHFKNLPGLGEKLKE